MGVKGERTIISEVLGSCLGEAGGAFWDRDGNHECAVAVNTCSSTERVELEGILKRSTCGTGVC